MALTAMMWFHSCSFTSLNGFDVAVPALLMRMSTFPMVSLADSVRSRTW